MARFTSSTRKDEKFDASVIAWNTRRTLCPRYAETSYCALCTQPFVRLRLEKVASVARRAPVEALASVTVIVSKAPELDVSVVWMLYQNWSVATDALSGMKICW